MSRLYSQEVSAATGHAAQLFSAIKSAVGKVPNAYAAIGNNSPVALEAALTLDGALKKSSLSAKDIEVIKLVVSEVVICDYCLAAHTLLGQKVGLDRDAILNLRRGLPTGDAHNDALASFTRSLVSTVGTVPADVFNSVKSAGFTDAQIVDIALAISSITFTNLINRINDTVVDFPAAD